MTKKRTRRTKKTERFSKTQKIIGVVIAFAVLLFLAYLGTVAVYNNAFETGLESGANQAIQVVLGTVSSCEQGFTVPIEVADANGQLVNTQVTLTLAECFAQAPGVQ